MPTRIPPLLPAPRKVVPREGALRLSPGVPIVVSGSSTESDFRAAEALRAAIAERSGLELPIETHFRDEDLGARLSLARGGEAGESYRVAIRPGVARAEGAGEAGLRYAAETVAQLLTPRSRSLPACDIEDGPELEKRGLLIDVSRGKVPTLETLKRLVDLMVELKLNLLMLYTEHVFRFRRHPLIGVGASRMRAGEIRELDGYAAARHVELVPTLQSLGHMHQVLKHARYRHLAESEKGWSISPALEESYALLDDLYSEYLGNFRSPWLNANCDEPVDLGKGLSKSRAEKEGLGAVFAAHLSRVQALAAKYGKQTMAWADVVHDHPDAIPRLPKELLLIDWWYEAEHDFDRVRVFRENQIPFLVAAGTSSWNTLFPRLDNAVANIQGYAAAAKRHGARGLLVTDWGDGGHANLLGNSTYGFAYGAQAAWGREDRERRSFDRAFSLQLFHDGSGAAARIYRGLGSLHDAGFSHFNHSPLRSLYFDDLDEAGFTAKVRPRKLEATLAKLRLRLADFERNEKKLALRPEEREELRFSLRASILAAEKGLLGHAYLHPEENPRGRGRRKRQALASELGRIASAQAALARTLEKLWLARNRPSNFEITQSLYDRSIRGLRRAARRAQSSVVSSRGAGRGRGR